MRPYYDAPDVVVPVRWYFAPPLARPLGMETAFGDRFYDNNPTFEPFVGHNYEFDASFVGNPRGYSGVRPCGTDDAWKNGVSFFDPPAPCNCVREDVVPIQEVPGGDIDGVNRAFTLSNVPMSAVSCLLFLNGVQQEQGVNYSLSSANIYFTAGSTPPAGANLVAYYWIQNI